MTQNSIEITTTNRIVTISKQTWKTSALKLQQRTALTCKREMLDVWAWQTG